MQCGKRNPVRAEANCHDRRGRPKHEEYEFATAG